MRLTPRALLLAAGVSRLAAQTPGTAPATPPQAGPTATLTLQEAQSIARRSNPSLQQTIGAQRSACARRTAPSCRTSTPASARSTAKGGSSS